jgi:hypothetical protein
VQRTSGGRKKSSRSQVRRNNASMKYICRSSCCYFRSVADLYTLSACIEAPIVSVYSSPLSLKSPFRAMFYIKCSLSYGSFVRKKMASSSISSQTKTLQHISGWTFPISRHYAAIGCTMVRNHCSEQSSQTPFVASYPRCFG